MIEKIVILDFGSQYTQLIARRVRELNVYCEIHPYNNPPQLTDDVKGVIFSGGPASVRDEDCPQIAIENYRKKLPLLGICYGAQYIAQKNGATVAPSKIREYGRAHLSAVTSESPLFKGIDQNAQVWMSHSDSIVDLPDTMEVVAHTDSIPVAAYQVKGEDTYGIQFHPEVVHTEIGLDLLSNFVKGICQCDDSWKPSSFVSSTVAEIKEKVGTEKVILGLSGGVDSSVAALLIHKAIGRQLTCIFVDNGLLRYNEFEEVLEDYKVLGLNVIGVDSKQRFYDALAGLEDPEAKRKAIGRVFIEVFDEESNKIEDAKWLAQGTIYPDIIESVSVKGPSATIKSHHNVGGLPDHMKLKLLEPLTTLFKDEVRKVGKE
ncbi:MAG: glutamine-hydrolyzing GMP synthase, partial [Cyclobacteriaceae bacterium]